MDRVIYLLLAGVFSVLGYFLLFRTEQVQKYEFMHPRPCNTPVLALTPQRRLTLRFIGIMCVLFVFVFLYDGIPLHIAPVDRFFEMMRP